MNESPYRKTVAVPREIVQAEVKYARDNIIKLPVKKGKSIIKPAVTKP